MFDLIRGTLALSRKAARALVLRGLKLVGQEYLFREHFSYRGYRIPTELVNLTGGGTSSWDEIAKAHQAQYSRYTPIEATHAVLEIGCGVGRDAIQLTDLLTSGGSYLGIDVIEPSIRWCQVNITPRHPQFRFIHVDAKSQLHNPGGRLEPAQIVLPVADASIDRIILQSVFTHMFEDAIVNYLREFRRVLRGDGRVFASFFLVDDEIRKRVKEQSLHFRYELSPGCFVIDLARPEAAVAYTLPILNRMMNAGGVGLVDRIHPGFWAGAVTPDSQDIVVMKRQEP